MSATAVLVPRSVGRVSFSPAKTAWLWINCGLAVVALDLGPRSTDLIAATALTFATLCCGHSVGLHRGLIHRTFRTSPFISRVLVGLFVLTGLGGPLSWIRLHRVRDYWQNQRTCPPYFAYRHGLARDFIWNLHSGFCPSSWGPYALDAKLEADRFLLVLERTWWLINIGFFLGCAATFGWRTALVLGPARMAGSILGHWLIGFWTHKHGTRRFRVAGASEEGTNSLLLGWISFGEGFHNNHHAHPGSARMGHRWWEFDLGWCVLVLLEQLGLVWDVRAWSRPKVSVPHDARRDEAEPERGHPAAALLSSRARPALRRFRSAVEPAPARRPGRASARVAAAAGVRRPARRTPVHGHDVRATSGRD